MSAGIVIVTTFVGGIILAAFGFHVTTTDQSWAAQNIGTAFIIGGIVAIVTGVLGMILVVQNS